MFSWFQRKRAEDGTEPQLARLEERAARASNGYESQHLLAAADLCARSGDAQRALRYYGRVMDGYLESGRLVAAEALCRRMLSAAPGTVRVRGTRMWLIAARGSVRELREAVAEYVRAGSAAAREDLVAHQLGLLAAASPPEVREVAAEALLNLGCFAEADRWLGSAYAERNGIAPSALPLADHEWGERMIEAVLLRPEKAGQQHPLSTAA